MTWNRQNATRRIDEAASGLETVEITDLTTVAQLRDIGTTQAQRVDAAHGYVEVLDAPQLVDTDQTESERAHKRVLRFLHVYQVVAHDVLTAMGAIPVDYQHHRLHFVVVEPFGDERTRVARAVMVADTLRRLVEGANELHTELPDARICIGIDSGRTLAVRNGTRGDLEPLFLGDAANQAAKLLAGGRGGVFLAPAAAQAVGLVASTAAIERNAIARCAQTAGVEPDLDALLGRWRAEVQGIALQDFVFTRPRPPLADLDFENLGPGSSRRIDAAVIYADLDGFTRYVADRVARRTGEAMAVQALHVLRKELRDVLRDFGGRKVRYIGDCLVGWLAEGPTETDRAQTVSKAALCAAAMRDSFALVQARLPDTRQLGLAVGVDAGPVSVTRLGVRGTRFRCAVGRAVGGAEAAQKRCGGAETALGEGALRWAGPVVRELFADTRPQTNITYNRVSGLLDLRGEFPAAASVIPTIRPRAWSHGP